MRNKAVKTTLKITLIIISVLFAAGIVFSCLGVVVGAHNYVDGYSEYYLYKKDYNPLRLLTFGGAVGKKYKIWFLPGQKQKLLERIKKDVTSDLINLVTSKSNLIKDFEISDDFKKIYIYYYKKPGMPYGFNLDKTVVVKVILYHEFMNGYGKTELRSILNFVEVTNTPSPSPPTSRPPQSS